SVAVLDADLSDTVLHSIANLAAIGLERARGEEATARAEAARHSSELRATVLDGLAHEFKTPLTSMKAAANSLLNSPSVGGRDRERATILDEDLARFQSLVGHARQMLRIDSGDGARRTSRRGDDGVEGERRNVGVSSEGTRWRFEHRRDGHQFVEHVGEGLTVDADRGLLELALRQLLDNALKYSPPTSTIELQAQSNGVVEIS